MIVRIARALATARGTELRRPLLEATKKGEPACERAPMIHSSTEKESTCFVAERSVKLNLCDGYPQSVALV